MRAVRERPRVFAVIGWLVLVLLLVGALIGATASAGAGKGAREALDAQRAAQAARVYAREEGERADELAEALEAKRRRNLTLGRELGDARRAVARLKRRAERDRK
jgi:hypothetical protein